MAGGGRGGRLHALVLRPIGDGGSEHLEEAVPLPAEITLAEGLQEVGREAPADAVCSVPTVSTRHAMLRVGASGAGHSRCTRSQQCRLPAQMRRVMLLRSGLLRNTEELSAVAAAAENGTDVFITDLNSTNGTFVKLPGAEAPQELEPMEWSPLPMGSQVVFGACCPINQRFFLVRQC